MLSQATLATELEAAVPASDVNVAAPNIGQAYGNYMKAATSNGVPAVAPFIDATCVPAFTGAFASAAVLPGTPASGAAAFLAGCVAFWGAAVAAPASFIVGATVIVPPTFLPLSNGTLAATLLSNTTNEETLADAAAAIAADLHLGTTVTPTAQFGVPVFPIV